MFSTEDFAQALDRYDYAFEVGQTVQGKVVSLERDSALVDIGGKSLGRLPLREAALQRIDSLAEVLELNDEREFLVVRGQDEEGEVTLSIRRLELSRAWQRMQEAKDSGTILQAPVTRLNRGGAIVEVEGLRGFVPRSHLVQPEAMEALVGQTLTLSFLDVNPDDNKLVLSERLAQRTQLSQDLSIGQLVEGMVTGIKPFGAFIDFNGVTGLLHIGEISQTFIESVGKLFERGQTVKAVIVSIDEARGRIGLSTKVLEKSPGEMLEIPAQVFEEAEKRAAIYRSRL
jgi:small subunit ribosomal protein S1